MLRYNCITIPYQKRVYSQLYVYIQAIWSSRKLFILLGQPICNTLVWVDTGPREKFPCVESNEQNTISLWTNAASGLRRGQGNPHDGAPEHTKSITVERRSQSRPNTLQHVDEINAYCCRHWVHLTYQGRWFGTFSILFLSKSCVRMIIKNLHRQAFQMGSALEWHIWKELPSSMAW